MASIRTVKKQPKRIDSAYNRQLGVVSYGDDNLYPQNVNAIVYASSTGILCYERYAEFIEGGGFDGFEDLEIDLSGTMLSDILQPISNDLAMYGGFAIHVNRNAVGAITDIQYIPFANCRLEEPNEDGVIKHIAYYHDWTGTTTWAGKTQRITKDKIDFIDVFSNDPKVISQQIKEAGGIKNWKGQILWVTASNRLEYPIPKADAILVDLSTDVSLGNVKYRNVENSFLPSIIMTTKGVPKEQESRADDYSDALTQFIGSDNIGGVLHIELDNQEEKPEFDEVKSHNFDKDFTTTNEDVISRIYARFNQEAFYSVRTSSAGFSGATQAEAELNYCKSVTKEQRMIERALKKTLDIDVKIKPLYDTVDNGFETNT